jgi:hypothetical protein
MARKPCVSGPAWSGLRSDLPPLRVLAQLAMAVEDRLKPFQSVKSSGSRLNRNLAFFKPEPGHVQLRSGFLDGILQPFMFGVRNLVANSEQTVDGVRIYLFQACVVGRQTGTFRDTPWYLIAYNIANPGKSLINIEPSPTAGAGCPSRLRPRRTHQKPPRGGFRGRLCRIPYPSRRWSGSPSAGPPE